MDAAAFYERSSLRSGGVLKPSISNTKASDLARKNYAGLSLSGGKRDKACLVVAEHFLDQDQLFVSKLYEGLANTATESADTRIVNLLQDPVLRLQAVAVDAPLGLPKCLRCKLQCPGVESCSEPEIQWMWNWMDVKNEKYRPKKLFTPYTQRCLELYLLNQLEEPFHIGHGLGSNLAPVAARAMFIRRRLTIKVCEYFPSLTLWRLGRELGIMKRYLRNASHSVFGKESREMILREFIRSEFVFVYEQDQKLLVENSHLFDAFLGTLTAFLSDNGLTEKRPKGFPKSESWIDFPIEEVFE